LQQSVSAAAQKLQQNYGTGQAEIEILCSIINRRGQAEIKCTKIRNRTSKVNYVHMQQREDKLNIFKQI
jgi:hypothetical protein